MRYAKLITGTRVALAVGLFLGVVGATLAAGAQQAGKVPRVGLIVFTPALKEAFLQGLP